jgi:hypothetical protein
MVGGVEVDRRGYTIEEAAALLQYHPDALRYWLRVGQLAGIRLGAAEPDAPGDDWLIGLDALVAFLRQNGETAPLDLPLAS